jgi:Asp-tRNA(Asn)/Glu-tRNA(Gln) amidotransferase C subunit
VDDTTTGMMDGNVTKEPVPIKKKELTREEEETLKRMEDIFQFFLELQQVRGGDLAPENAFGI